MYVCRQSSERDTHDKIIFMDRTPKKSVCISKAENKEQHPKSLCAYLKQRTKNNDA